MAGVGTAIRLVHPFPSVLDAIVTAVIALLAGATPERALLLGAAMFSIQASIGTLNDLADLPADRVAKPGKPIVRGVVSVGTARGVTALGLAVGVALSALLGVGVVSIALLGAGIGYLYDLRLKGTGWAWLPFAVGVPLLPVYAWVGATGELPSAFAILVPTAVAAGAALALGNQLDDLADDTAAGVDSTVRRLGPRAALVVIAVLYAGVGIAVIGSLAAVGGWGAGAVVVGIGLAILMVGILAAGSWRGALGRWAWELQGVGVGIVAAGWLAALGEAGALAS